MPIQDGRDLDLRSSRVNDAFVMNAWKRDHLTARRSHFPGRRQMPTISPMPIAMELRRGPGNRSRPSAPIAIPMAVEDGVLSKKLTSSRRPVNVDVPARYRCWAACKRLDPSATKMTSVARPLVPVHSTFVGVAAASVDGRVKPAMTGIERTPTPSTSPSFDAVAGSSLDRAFFFGRDRMALKRARHPHGAFSRGVRRRCHNRQSETVFLSDVGAAPVRLPSPWIHFGDPLRTYWLSVVGSTDAWISSSASSAEIRRHQLPMPGVVVAPSPPSIFPFFRCSRISGFAPQPPGPVATPNRRRSLNHRDIGPFGNRLTPRIPRLAGAVIARRLDALCEAPIPCGHIRAGLRLQPARRRPRF